ncbi:START domain protein [Gregarina niphandrodes]|uniref:START domain protein n=1 Tax=Gregarina niphandrodes TaxID=110365 RepID=A0A023B474_GRENI|nr:START domain protein [Gregarina niphandrodes]EZG56402.1 START domain protein [Gregarina niphandrodes]|eukprot:XP_011131275.1 START domain protein [Gregarina niphandrodes]
MTPLQILRSTSARKQANQPSAEKRFFKNFDDLKDFDPQLKHKIPIGLYEFGMLDQFLPEKPLGKWQLAVNKGTTRIYKQIVDVKGSDLVMVKGYALFENITIENIVYNLKDLPRRTAWDKTFDGFSLIEGDIQGNEITYNAIRAPWPVADREFLQWRRTVYNDIKLPADGSRSPPALGAAPLPLVDALECRILHRSAEHPAFPESTKSAVIRAESVISAYVFTQIKNKKDTYMIMLTQCDIRGVVPKWMVNSQAAKAPIQWVDNFRKACNQTRDQFGDKIPKYVPKPVYTNGIKNKV